MDMKVADPLHGALLDGRYRIKGRVARGGMATVYHATDERLERAVAIKIIHPAHARDDRFLARFTDEAKTIARLTHPNVVAVYDQGTHDGLPYLVMEYVRGRTLRELLTERRRLHPSEALAILEQMLAAIAVAHRAGLVHRDVKPENVLVAPPPNGSGDLVDAVVKVADFGLARAVEAAGHDQAGQLMATAAYVAPELVSEGQSDPRADVYSAGIVLFEMLTGRVPYDGDRPVDVAWQHVDRDVPPPSKFVPGLLPLLDDVVARATRRDPGGRPMDAGALLAEVQSAREDLGALTAPTRALVHPTMVVHQVSPGAPAHRADDRPAWARLPAGRGTLGRVGAARPPQAAAGPPVDAGKAQILVDAWQRAVDTSSRMRGTQRGRRQLLAAAVVLGLVLVSGGWWLGFGRYVQAPNLVNLTRANAAAEAERLGFDIHFGAGIYSDKDAKDTVLQQQPAAGEKIVRGGTLTLRLSLGPERYPVPEVSGQALDFALSQLKEHFLVQQTSGFSDTVPVNFVISTDPAVGTPLPPGATVKLVVATGPYPAHVPALVGKSLGEAQGILAGQGFTQVETQYEQNQEKPRDTVLKQTPADGQGVADPAATKIVLVLSEGPPGVPMPAVINMGCNDAANQLRGMGLNVQVDAGPFEQQFGHVTEQAPNPNDPVQSGQEVRIKCGL